MLLFRTLMKPTYSLLPSLIVNSVGVCLVLAPDIDLFLNSRK